MDLTYTQDERMVLDMVHDFAESDIRPYAAQWDQEETVPLPVLRKMQELGLFGLMIPEEYGGAGVSTACYAAVIEEVSRVCAAVAIALSVHNSVGAFPVLRFGGEEQKRHYLPLLASRWIGAFSLTEPEAGSDAARLRLKAEKLPEGDYLLNGTKSFVTNGSIADLYLVMGRTAELPEAPHRGVTAFLVERSLPGVSPGKMEHKTGLRASDTTELVFENCRVPESQRLGAEGQGFKIAMMSLDNGRIGVGAQATGIAQGALEEAAAYAQTRRQFDRPIASFQAVQFMLADMQTQIRAARLLVQNAAWLKDAGEPHGKEAAMAKLFASRMANRVVHDAVQIHGGYGYTREYAVERYARDARVTEIYEGTSEMQRLVIARHLLRG